jgi:hypothetical protein
MPSEPKRADAGTEEGYYVVRHFDGPPEIGFWSPDEGEWSGTSVLTFVEEVDILSPRIDPATLIPSAPASDAREGDVERVAEAMANVCRTRRDDSGKLVCHEHWRHLSREVKTEFLEYARAAISAMPAPSREPSEAMVEAGHDSDCAVHNEPAYPAGPCDCGTAMVQVPRFIAKRALVDLLAMGSERDWCAAWMEGTSDGSFAAIVGNDRGKNWSFCQAHRDEIGALVLALGEWPGDGDDADWVPLSAMEEKWCPGTTLRAALAAQSSSVQDSK